MLAPTPGTDADDPSVFGELAHTVAKRTGGPRGGKPDEDKPDGHENLMPLCNKHHKQIDDQPNHFTIEKLQAIKRDHIPWTAAQGHRPQPMRIVPDPAHPTPKKPPTITTASQPWPMVLPGTISGPTQDQRRM